MTLPMPEWYNEAFIRRNYKDLIIDKSDPKASGETDSSDSVKKLQSNPHGENCKKIIITVKKRR